MEPDLIFRLGNLAVLPGWVALLFFPQDRFQVWRGAVVRTVLPLLLSTAYVILIVGAFGRVSFDFGSLAGVMAVFTDPFATTAGWYHYLAFDLLVGSYVLETGRAEGVHHVALIPCLLLTFIFGPGGYLLFLAVRSIRKMVSRTTDSEGASA